jgi:hypothetical protein
MSVENNMNRRLIFIWIGVLFFILALGLLTQVIYVQAHPESATAWWVQTNQDGFGDAGNGQVPSLTVHDGYLYSGTQNYGAEPDQAEIWRSSSGTDWIQVDDRAVNGAAALISFGDYIYAGSWGESDLDGGDVWRSQNGEDWSDVTTNGFGDSHNGIARFALFENMLYASTWNGTTGTEIWRTDDGVEWEQFGPDGLDNNLNNSGAIASAEFDGYLYWGVGNWVTGAQLWRTDGESLEPIIQDGFGTVANPAVTALAAFDGYLYANVWNPGGIQIWRSDMGTNWLHIIDGTIGSASSHNEGALEVYNGMLYLIIRNDDIGLEVWCTENGTDWIQVGFGGLGDSNNTWTFWDNGTTVFEGKLYVAASNYDTGGEIWALTNPLFKVNLPMVTRLGEN